MNELMSLGVILLFALFAGHLVKFARVPEITGYILAGIAVGPFGMGWLSHDNLASLSVFSEVALGLILFSLGSVFEAERFKVVGQRVLRVTLAESLLTAALVTGGMLLFGQTLEGSLLLGTIAMETAAASTLMVMRECNAEGPLSDTLTGIIGINNIFCLIGFSLVAAGIDLKMQLATGGDWLVTIYGSLYPLIWQLIGSVALGFLVGVLLASWSLKVVEHGEIAILLIGCVLLCVGAALLLELSPLIASLSVGATLTNLSSDSRRLFHALSRSDPPFYAIFFVIAGADLNLGLITSIGSLGLVYLLARFAGKFLGARLASRREGFAMPVQRWLGFGLMSHAGLAVGLTMLIHRRFPALGDSVGAIVLAAVVICEMVGPLSARLAIVRSGEAHAKKLSPDEALAELG